MNVDEVLTVVEQLLLSRELSAIERLVLHRSWKGQTYSEISQDSAYGSDYIKEVGSKLWDELSEALGQRVTKKNFHLVLKQYRQKQAGLFPSRVQQPLSEEEDEAQAPTVAAQVEIEFPGRPVAVNSPLYVNRPPIEEQAFAAIQKPGCLLRIKAPRKMGKSSLVNRLVATASNFAYKTVRLDFQEAEIAIFADLDKFLRWFCANIAKQLRLPARLDDYWDEDIGSKISCKLYFEGYLLEAIAAPIVLVLNEVNQIFEYPALARDFLPMLRTWHEAAAQDAAWQKLRLVVVHSTEIYVPLKLNQSPFNVGLALKLPEFTLEQVQALALAYGFTWAEGDAGREQLAPLVKMVGGHPYLIGLALYHLWRKAVTLEQLLEEAPQPTGIYGEYLRNLLVTLQEDPPLGEALKQIINASESSPIEANAAYKLESLGVVRLEGNKAKSSGELYRLFFREHLKNPRWIDDRVEQLEQENIQLQQLSYVDELTHLANRRYFNQYMQTSWQQPSGEMPPVSVILCDVDYFRYYNEAWGQVAGDECLRKIASAIQNSVKHRANVVARYGGEEFAIILPQTDAKTAGAIAEDMRVSVKALAIAHDISKIGGLPDKVLTLSLGVATLKPGSKNSPSDLVAAADEALYQSKRLGRDRVTLR